MISDLGDTVTLWVVLAGLAVPLSYLTAPGLEAIIVEQAGTDFYGAFGLIFHVGYYILGLTFLYMATPEWLK